VITVDGIVDGNLAVEIIPKVGLLGKGTMCEVGNELGK